MRDGPRRNGCADFSSRIHDALASIQDPLSLNPAMVGDSSVLWRLTFPPWEGAGWARLSSFLIKEIQIVEFHVPDMSCGHCVSAVTNAIKAVDPHAKVEVDLSAHTVRVDSPQSPQVLAESLSHAGYPVRE